MSNFVEVRGARIYAIHLRGGSADYACSGHVAEARRDRGGELVSVARIDDSAAECVYCGIRQGERRGSSQEADQ